MDIFKYALQFIDKNNDVLISDELIIELYNIITDGTLEDVNISERYRNDTVILKNIGHEIVYVTEENNIYKIFYNSIYFFVYTSIF